MSKASPGSSKDVLDFTEWCEACPRICTCLRLPQWGLQELTRVVQCPRSRRGSNWIPSSEEAKEWRIESYREGPHNGTMAFSREVQLNEGEEEEGCREINTCPNFLYPLWCLSIGQTQLEAWEFISNRWTSEAKSRVRLIEGRYGRTNRWYPTHSFIAASYLFQIWTLIILSPFDISWIPVV